MASRTRESEERQPARWGGSTSLPIRLGAFILVTFLLVFPKGGVKFGGIPVTWGYILLGLSTLPFLLQLAHGARMRLAAPRLTVAAALLPFQFIVWATLLLHGTTGMGFAVSLVVSFFFIPLALVIALGVYLDRMDLGPLFRMLRVGILLVAAYGIFLFIYKLKTGSFIEIPYLTVNAGDVGGLEDKYIDRGGIFKLISTYNNGNIYGVSMLILLPLYGWLEKSRVRQGIVKASLLLTLSRTVWVGLVVYEVLQRVHVKRVSARALALLGLALVGLGLGVAYAMSLMDRNVSFLFDRNLGGRLGQLGALETARALPNAPFETIYEIVYLSVMESFGILGLAAFLVAMATPVALHLLRATPYAGSTYKRNLAAGLITYLIVSMSDGALLFIPVMVFYWFMVSLLVSDNPSFAVRAEEERLARASPVLEVEWA
jgi:hypothetical protein